MDRFTRRDFIATSGALTILQPIAAKQSPNQEAPPEELSLWYTKPATQWVDALPIGNGRLGAMVFGGGAINVSDLKVNQEAGPVPTDPAKETLQLNEDTLWSGLPVDGNNLQAK